MKAKDGKNVSRGSWLMCVHGKGIGMVRQVYETEGKLCIETPDGPLPLAKLADGNGHLAHYVTVRNPRKKSGYPENARRFKEAELQEAGTVFVVETHDLDEEAIANLIACGYTDVTPGETGVIWTDILTMSEAGIETYDAESAEYDDEQANDILSQFIRPSSHYLVYAAGCRWNGADGYKLVHDMAGLVRRSYDATISPVAASKNGKVLICRESSHDVPMGSTTIMVALTDREYDRFKEADFASVRKWAEKCRRSVPGQA